jgi:hypothetical protein
MPPWMMGYWMSKSSVIFVYMGFLGLSGLIDESSSVDRLNLQGVLLKFVNPIDDAPFIEARLLAQGGL